MIKGFVNKCSKCGAPIDPPKRGNYSCDFCGAKYSTEGLFEKSTNFLKIITKTKGYNSSIIIPVGLGSVLLALLIFRYPSFQKNKIKIVPTPQTQNIIINQPNFEGNFLEESIEKNIKESIKKSIWEEFLLEKKSYLQGDTLEKVGTQTASKVIGADEKDLFLYRAMGSSYLCIALNTGIEFPKALGVASGTFVQAIEGKHGGIVKELGNKKLERKKIFNGATYQIVATAIKYCPDSIPIEVRRKLRKIENSL